MLVKCGYVNTVHAEKNKDTWVKIAFVVGVINCTCSRC